MRPLAVTCCLVVGILAACTTTVRAQAPATDASPAFEYRLLATSKTSTMQRELTDAAEGGFRFVAFMGGETAFGGNEVVAVMMRQPGARARFAYKMLATSKTSSMERELQEAADAGFEYKSQSVFESAFGGQEVVLILERDKDVEIAQYTYRLLATSKTSTMQKELGTAGQAGYEMVGMTLGKTAFGGSEIVAITRRATPGR